jgi:hypothetical protein
MGLKTLVEIYVMLTEGAYKHYPQADTTGAFRVRGRREGGEPSGLPRDDRILREFENDCQGLADRYLDYIEGK